jgi:hypothetical protein
MGLGTVLDDLDGTDHATTEQRIQRIVFFFLRLITVHSVISLTISSYHGVRGWDCEARVLYANIETWTLRIAVDMGSHSMKVARGSRIRATLW